MVVTWNAAWAKPDNTQQVRHVTYAFDGSGRTSISLQFPNNSIHFDFLCPEPTVVSDTVLYKVWLDGLYDEWSPWFKQDYIAYKHLHDGSYALHVKCRLPNGKILDGPTVSLQVLPPWYRSKTAYLGFGLAGMIFLFFCGFAWGKFSREVNRKRQRELEELIQQRTCELKVANQQLEQQNDELERLSITDPLTGLYNRLRLEKLISNEVEKSSRDDSTFSIILIDIDDFKKVNDTYGHQTGDNVLASFARVLVDNVRSSDSVGRWGGEEFLVLCPDTEVQDAAEIAEKLRTACSSASVASFGSGTCSLGVAEMQQGQDASTLLHKADEALYQAKRNGKNTVVIG